MPISRMQQPRQNYGLGSLVKSITKGVKKIAKSPLGKAALLYAGGAGLGALGAGSAGTGFGLKMFGPKAFASNLGMSLGKLGLGSKFIGPSKPGLFGLTGSQAALGIGAASTLAGILASDADMTEEEAEQLKQDPVALKNYLTLYYSNLNPRASKKEVDSFVRTNMYADGGRVNYQQGSQPASAPAQLGSPQGGTSLYGNVLEYLKRQDKDAPQGISPEGIPGAAMPFGGGSFNQSGGAINTPMSPAVVGPGTGMLQPPSPPSPTPTPPNNVPPAIKEVDPFLKKYYQQSYDTYKDLIAEATKGRNRYGVNTMDLFRKGSLERQHMSDEELSAAFDKITDTEFYTERVDGTPVVKQRDIDLGLYVPTMTEYLLDQGDIKTAAKSLQDLENYKYKDYEDFLQQTGTGYQYEKALAQDPNYRAGDPFYELYKEYKGYNDGGRIGYAMGSPEQNAMQAAGIMNLPLNQNKAGVTELDLRESGGFIPPVGVKEKADDIPAMLSNNEFVFTADAVRGMGDGNVNKGAQRMYDMMKKLEKGGRV